MKHSKAFILESKTQCNLYDKGSVSKMLCFRLYENNKIKVNVSDVSTTSIKLSAGFTCVMLLALVLED